MSDSVQAAVESYFQTIRPEPEAADAFVKLFADDARFEDPVGTKVLEGEAGLRAFHKGLCRAWKRLSMEPEHVQVRGDRAAVAWRASGTSASGSDISFEGINILAVDGEGRIQSLEGYWDLEGVIAQM